MTTFTCPCCNSQIKAPPDVSSLAEVGGGLGRQIVKALVAVYPRGLEREQIVERIYAGSQAPLTVEWVIAVQMGRLRKLLEPHGWTIPRQGGKGGHERGVYKLVPLA